MFGIIYAHCETLFTDVKLIEDLRSRNFTVALVDLIGNECSLALAHHLGIPVLGFWGFTLQGSEVNNNLLEFLKRNYFFF